AVAVAAVIVELLLHVHDRFPRFAADEHHDIVVDVALDPQVHLGRGATHHVVHPVARVGTPRLQVRRATIAPHHQLRGLGGQRPGDTVGGRGRCGRIGGARVPGARIPGARVPGAGCRCTGEVVQLPGDLV